MKTETTRRLMRDGLNILISTLAFYMFSILGSMYDFSNEAVYICTLLVFLNQRIHDDIRELKKSINDTKEVR